MHLVMTADRRKAMHYVASLDQEADFPVEPLDESGLERLLDDIPVQRKSDMIDYVESHRDGILEQAVLFSETSGTTGCLLQTPRGDTDLAWNIKNQMFAYGRHLKKGRDRIAIIHPGMLSPFIEATTYALRNMGIGYVKVFPIEGICEYRRMYEVLRRYEITAIMTTPSLALKTFYEIERIASCRDLKLRKLLLTGELISKACVANFKKILGDDCDVTAFVYGASETASLMYGVGADEYEAFLDDFIFEIVDGQQSPVTSDGYRVTGELYVTWLGGGLLPVRRYNTGDLFEVAVQGKGHYRFKPLGRSSLEGYDNNLLLRLEEIIYGLARPVFNYRVEFDKAGQRARIDIVTLGDGEDGTPRELAERIGHELPGYDIRVRVNAGDDPFLAFAPKPKRVRFTY